MLAWMKKRKSTTHDEGVIFAPAARPPVRGAGKYQRLYEYLEARYADTVVLTFQQVEDILGFALPDRARQEPVWWSATGLSPADDCGSNAWTLARRSALPNLRARTVAFERVSRV
jgi:hypothetical protein